MLGSDNLRIRDPYPSIRYVLKCQYWWNIWMVYLTWHKHCQLSSWAAGPPAQAWTSHSSVVWSRPFSHRWRISEVQFPHHSIVEYWSSVFLSPSDTLIFPLSDFNILFFYKNLTCYVSDSFCLMIFIHLCFILIISGPPRTLIPFSSFLVCL